MISLGSDALCVKPYHSVLVQATTVAGTRLLASFRMLVVSALANLVIEANQFEVTAQPPDASTVADPKAQ